MSADSPSRLSDEHSDLLAAAIFEQLSRHLKSTEDPEGISALAARILDKWGALISARITDLGNERAKTLGAALVQVAKECDRFDLVAKDIPLRSVMGGQTQGSSKLVADVNVCAKIVRAIAETLFAHEALKFLELIIQALTSAGNATLYDDAFFLRLACINLYRETGNYDAAVTAARTNLAFGCCPTSQFLLYKSLLEQSNSGASVSRTEICLDDLSDRFCPEPFSTLATGTDARKTGEPPFHACQCPGTLPYPVSNYEKGVTIESLWNGPEIQELRRSILDGDFTYCSRMLCPEITGKTLPKRTEVKNRRLRDIIDNRRTRLTTTPTKLTLGHDPSCNIACPSCRNEIMIIKNSSRERLDRATDEIFLPLMEDESLQLIISTDGDPLGSKHYRRIIHSLDPVRHTSVKVSLITNGLLLTAREWQEIRRKHSLINFVGVSIDGACAETYEELRRPGKWETITANMDFLSGIRASRELRVLGLQFVVQAKNFEEMADFVRLGQGWNADIIRFIRLMNIGSYSSETFEENDVSDPRHPLNPRLMSVLDDPIFDDPRVDMFTLKPLWEVAKARN